MNRAFAGRAVLALAVLAGPTSCAQGPALSAAQAGDWNALRTALDQRQRDGDLGTAEAASIARQVARQTLERATGALAQDRARDARPCARELDEALAAAMERHDGAGAEAALERIDTGELPLYRARLWANDSDPRWRAVAVRALTRPEDARPRGRALLDASPEVRREAARASRDAAMPRDLPLLFEAARLDPEPMVRTEAVRAIAAQPRAPDDGVARRLGDLWTTGDDGLREDIAFAYAQPSLLDAGGREALQKIVSSDHGPGAVDAAVAVLRSSRPSPNNGLLRDAAAALARSIASGPRRERLQAIATAPLGPPPILSAVEEATRDEDVRVRVAALARMLERRAPNGEQTLEALAAPGSPVAGAARRALAGAGDRRIQAWLEHDLVAPAPRDRLEAAASLAAMRLPSRGAPLLADADPSVRMRAACIVLVASRRAP